MTAAHKNPEHDDEIEAVEVQATLLVVDDHPVTADLERNYFSGIGFKVFVAASAAEVEKIVRKKHIDLIIIDLNFNRGKGAALLASAKSHSLNTEIKAIATSVVGTPANKKAAEDAGADGFLLKPAPRPKVLRQIKALALLKSRDTERVKQNVDVELRIGKKSLLANSLDISSEGIHLALKGKGKAPEVGTALELSFSPGKDSKDLKELILKGEVVRHTKEGFGVRFHELNKTSQRTLDKFLLIFSMESRASKFYL